MEATFHMEISIRCLITTPEQKSALMWFSFFMFSPISIITTFPLLPHNWWCRAFLLPFINYLTTSLSSFFSLCRTFSQSLTWAHISANCFSWYLFFSPITDFFLKHKGSFQLLPGKKKTAFCVFLSASQLIIMISSELRSFLFYFLITDNDSISL